MASKTIIIKAQNQTQSGISGAIASLKTLDAQVGKLEHAFNTLAQLTVFSVIGEGIKKVIEGAIDCANEFGKMQRTMIQTYVAVGGSNERFEEMEKLISSVSKRTLEGKDSVEQLVAKITSLGYSNKNIEKLTQASVAWSNVMGEDLNGSFTKINATLSGQIKGISKLLPEVKNLTEAQLASGAAADLIISKFKKISDAMATGWSQTVHNLGLAWSDFKKEIGSITSTALEPFVKVITGLFEYFKNNKDDLIGTITGIGVAIGVVIMSLNPVLGVIQIIGAGIFWLVQTAGSFKILWLEIQEFMLMGAKDIQDRFSTLTNGIIGLMNGILKTYNSIAARFKLKPLDLIAKVDFSESTGIDCVIADLEEKIKNAKSELNKKPSVSPNNSSNNNGSLFASETWKGANGSWSDVDASKTPWALAAKNVQDAADSMAKVADELEKHKWGNADWNQGGAVTSYNSGSASYVGSNGIFGSTGFTGFFKNILSSLGSSGAFSSITNTIKPLLNIIKPLIENFGNLKNILGKFNIWIAILQLIIEGFVNKIQGPLTNFVDIILDAIKNIGSELGETFMPILEDFAPMLKIIAQIINETVTPLMSLITSINEILDSMALLDVLEYSFKALAIAIVVLTSPLNFLADMFQWVGEVFKVVGYNIGEFASNLLKPWDADYKSMPSAFTSDAFTSLADQIEAIWNGNYSTDLTASSTSTGSSSASYSGPQTVNIYNYLNGTFYSEADLDKHLIKVTQQALAEQSVGMA
jgi:hypothetical protein